MLLSQFVVVVCLLAAEDPFQAPVRSTEPLTAEQQRETLRVPPGFEVQLFASEPEIQKPMNLAFDGAGRLWVSGSVEYPFAAAEGQGRDAIKVLEDTDGDGRADKFTTFVDGLNIPIGLYPYRNGVICYSIPNIWFFQDTDGDGKADKREILYGPLGTPRDTHGMQNAIRRGFDGWLYICHGFSNESVIRGRDGSSITLQSGNTYRLRVDGSHVEQYTWGQVNPFGSVFTPAGDLITSDCHSNPLTLLLRGGYYSSFGKPHDGLGFIAPIMTHTHGSTAIAGAAICSGESFPPEYRGSVFLGNVMTSRVHRDALVYHGSTAEAQEKDDFIISDDPWFRPVDIQFGADGALYVADFYNRIIGHYEVSLTHPGRDKGRARIWRVVYRGEKSSSQPPVNLEKADLTQLLEALGDPNLSRRLAATDQISDRFDDRSAEIVRRVLQTQASPERLIHAAWVLHRWNQLTASDLQTLAERSESLVRIHAMRMLAEAPRWEDDHQQLMLRGLADAHPMVVRAAADAAGQHPELDATTNLLQVLEKVPARDLHLRQTLRMALRNQLLVSGRLESITSKLTPSQRQPMASIALGLATEDAGTFLLGELESGRIAPAEQQTALAHVARNLPAAKAEQVVAFGQSLVPDSPELQLQLLLAVNQGLTRRGTSIPDSLRDWGTKLFRQLLGGDEDPQAQWRSSGTENPWGLEPRNSADGRQQVPFLSSLPGGEKKTGVLRSPTFEIPVELSFYLCGHLGFPQDPPRSDNFVQLRLASTGEVLAKALPPRSDTAQKISWKVSHHVGEPGYIEIVDGLDLDAYAWLAVARFEPSVVRLPQAGPQVLAQRRQAAGQLAEQLQLTEVASELRGLVLDTRVDATSRASAARALGTIRREPLTRALAELLGDNSETIVRERLAAAFAEENEDAVRTAAHEIMQSVPARLQTLAALRLSETTAGADFLLTLVSQGRVSPRLLQPEGMRQRLLAARPDRVEERIAELTHGLPAESDRIELLLKERREGWAKANRSTEKGKAVFTKHCVACHQVQGQGTLVGPQLDGIGNRGSERIIEDVLDPNRNVDVAFHTAVITLDDGRVLVGLPRRDEGNATVFVNNEGKEFAIARAEIEEQRKLPNSIMPANFGELIPADEFYDLLAYLAAQTGKKPETER